MKVLKFLQHAVRFENISCSDDRRLISSKPVVEYHVVKM